MAEPLPTPALFCPECRHVHNVGGMARIGNRRSQCQTCNNFAQNVMRITRKRLKESHPEEYDEIRQQVEKDLYPQVIENWGVLR
jgi:hypothetical protein